MHCCLFYIWRISRRAFHSVIYDVTESNRGVTDGVWSQNNKLS